MRAACRSAGAPHRAAEVDISIIRHVVSGEMVFFFFFVCFFTDSKILHPLSVRISLLCVCVSVCVCQLCCCILIVAHRRAVWGEKVRLESANQTVWMKARQIVHCQEGRFSRDGCALIKYSLQVEWLRSGVNSSRGGIDNLRMVWCWFNPFLQILSCSSWNFCFCFLFKGNTL